MLSVLVPDLSLIVVDETGHPLELLIFLLFDGNDFSFVCNEWQSISVEVT